MEKQQSWIGSERGAEKKMSLVAFLFFMMGALHVYGWLQASNRWDREAIDTGASYLVKIAVLGVLLASLIEISIAFPLRAW